MSPKLDKSDKSDKTDILEHDINTSSEMAETMYVVKRTGEREEVSFDKCLKRIQKLSKDLKINPMEVSQLIITQIYDGVETNKLDELAAEICAAKTTIHPDYGRLASRIIVSNHHKNTSPSYSEVVQVLWDNKDVHGAPSPLINEALYKMVMDNKEKINATLDYDKDFNYDYFGFKTLERAYLLRIGTKIIERPQHMIMRVALAIHKDDLKEALKAYKMMSEGYFTHATPTLFNMGTQREQASSCFLMTIDDDSIDGIYKTLADCAKISKYSGGIGVAIHKIRAKGSRIRGTNGTGDGIVPMLKVFNETARYVNQSGRRAGSFACFAADTEVLTINEGVKKIQDVKIGDLVITHNNRVKPVIQTHKNPLGDRKIYKLEVEKNKPIYVTGNHRFWSSKTKSNESNSIAQWHSIDELRDFINENQNHECYAFSPKMLEVSAISPIINDNKGNIVDRKTIAFGKKIINITETVRDDEYVYTLGVQDDHSYTVEGLLAENCYLEPWHADIEDFLKMRLNTGIEEERARDLFYSLWTPDLFMRRVEEDGDWTLMCPDKCPGLYLKYGREFDELYTQYEREGRGNKVVKARKIWEMFLQAQIETGMPYLGFKDAINEKNNQKNLGTIQSSNLCHEICEYTSKDEIAVCNLASVALPKFVEKDAEGKMSYNFEKLREVVKQVVKNLNKVIDYNYYPVKEAENSNRRHRNIGTGVQGLSDTFAMMKMAFDSPEARVLNRKIFENIYFAALEASMELARKRKKFVQEYKRLLKLGSNATGNGELTAEDISRLAELKKTHWIIDEELKLPAQYAGAYSSFVGSPLSEGKLQFDMWGVSPSPDMEAEWTQLRTDVLKHGARNSLLIATMPTASTSQVLGWTECFEPFTNNIYTRKTLAGTFVVVNKYLINDLLELGLWTPAMKDRIILADGSVQGITEIPQEIRERYKTVWEMSQRVIIDMTADRSPFICQTSSMNLFVKSPTFKTLNAMHFHSWKSGLKTGCYYLRSQAKTAAQKFSVDLEKVKKENKIEIKAETKEEAVRPVAKVEEKQEPECLMCSS
jgi:ribonucleotide reductase alpha subunit